MKRSKQRRFLKRLIRFSCVLCVCFATTTWIFGQITYASAIEEKPNPKIISRVEKLPEVVTLKQNVQGDISTNVEVNNSVTLNRTIQSSVKIQDYNQLVTITSGGKEETYDIFQRLIPYSLEAYHESQGKVLPSVFLTQIIAEGGWDNIKLFLNTYEGTNFTYEDSDRGFGLLFGQFTKQPLGDFGITPNGGIVQIHNYINLMSNYYMYDSLRTISLESVTTTQQYKERSLHAISKLGPYHPANPEYVNQLSQWYTEKYQLWLVDEYAGNMQ